MLLIPMSSAMSLQSFHPLSSSNPHNKSKKNRPPLFISTNPSHLNLLHLRDLFFSTNLSCHRFPHLDPSGRVEPVDLDKLRTAVLHSSVVVSVFSRGEFCEGEGREMEKSEFGIGELIRRAVPVSESNGTLVGFGRAVSDCGLTASIYDVACVSGYSFIARIGNWSHDSEKNYKGSYQWRHI